MPKVGFVSLGCPKNLVDSEVMLGLLGGRGYELTSRAEDADIFIVNTCSFIEPAKRESIGTILAMAEYKKSGAAKKLIVAGCLVERYRQEILKEIPEVDFVMGTNELERIVDACAAKASGRSCEEPIEPYRLSRIYAQGPLHPQLFRLHQNRRGVRPPLLFLCDPANAGSASLALN